jgi:hypothetical protein
VLRECLRAFLDGEDTMEACVGGEAVAEVLIRMRGFFKALSEER